MAQQIRKEELQNATEVAAIVIAGEEAATEQVVADVTVDPVATSDAPSPEIGADAGPAGSTEAGAEVGAEAPTDAGADPAVEAVAAAIGEVVPKKPSRKAKLATETAATTEDVVPDYAALGVAEQDVPKYEKLRLRFVELGRLETNQVFECGEVVHELHELAGDLKAFAKAAKAVLKLSRTGAANYERVHLYLQPHRARLVKVAMIASGLYNLTGAEPEKVEEVLAARESGVSLTGAQIKVMLGKASAPAAPDDGGPEGLRAAVAEKTGYASKVFFETVVRMLRAVHIVLEPHREGRQVNKGKAVAELMHDARLASGLLKSLVFAAQVPGGLVPAGIIHILPVAENRWVRTERVLYDMGAVESWPKSEKVGTWL